MFWSRSDRRFGRPSGLETPSARKTSEVRPVECREDPTPLDRRIIHRGLLSGRPRFRGAKLLVGATHDAVRDHPTRGRGSGHGQRVAVGEGRGTSRVGDPLGSVPKNRIAASARRFCGPNFRPGNRGRLFVARSAGSRGDNANVVRPAAVSAK